MPTAVLGECKRIRKWTRELGTTAQLIDTLVAFDVTSMSMRAGVCEGVRVAVINGRLGAWLVSHAVNQVR